MTDDLGLLIDLSHLHLLSGRADGYQQCLGRFP
jgi:hypothetical protein